MSFSSEQSQDGCQGSEGDQHSAAGRVDPDGQRQLRSADLWKSSHQLTIDTNTVHQKIKLSDNNRKMTRVSEVQNYPDHPDRFDYWNQLLCREGLTGVHYWEVQWSGGVSIAVSYRGIRRKGSLFECMFGHNHQSWCLGCGDSHYIVTHNGNTTELPSVPVTYKVGVLLDHPAGTLTFYAVHPFDMTEIYTFRTTFTEPVYAGFTIWYCSSASLLTVAS